MLQPMVRRMPSPMPALPAAWQCDLADDRLTWAPGVYALFGLPLGSALDRAAIVAMYCDESRATLDRLRAEAISKGKSFTFEARIRRPNDEERLMLLTADVIFTNGRPSHLYGSKQDITEDQAPLTTIWR